MPPSRKFDVHAIDAVAISQGGIVTFSQLRALGMSPSTISRWTRSGGRWQRLLPAVYLVHRGQPAREERLHAAQIYAGPNSLFTGFGALHLHGLRNLPTSFNTATLHLLLPKRDQIQSAGFVVIERTKRLPQAHEIHGFRVAPLARSLFDAGRRTSDRQVIRAFVLEAIQRQLIDIEDLRKEIRLGPRQWTAVLRDVLGEGAAGTRSVPEAELRRLVTGSELPEPLWNPRLETLSGEFIAEPDAYVKELGLAVEVDSRKYHFENSDHYVNTWARHRRYAEHGIAVLRLMPTEIRLRPASVIASLEATAKTQQGRPTPRVRVISRVM
ncbi:MAG: type IV toxin-antitoxin system AbiEi family antitoxin domain-containing protein [Actinomycetes bacterium]